MRVTYKKKWSENKIVLWLCVGLILMVMLLLSYNILHSGVKGSNSETVNHISNYQTSPSESPGNDKDDFFAYFVNEAYKYPADFEANHTIDSMPWLDEKLLNRSVSFYDKNFFGISLAIIYSSVELFAIKSTTSVLMFSGTVDNRRKAIERILRTIVIMKSWGNAGMNIFDANSSASKYMEIVLRKHHRASCTSIANRSAASVDFMDKNVLEPPPNWHDLRELVAALKTDLKFVDTREAPGHLLNWDTSTSVGQFDLGVVQFLVICHVVMTPNSFGIDKENQEDILAHIHASAVFGRLLGIQDRFNIALNLPFEMYERFYRNIILASLKNIDEHSVHVMSLTMEAMMEEFPVHQFLRLKCWLYHSLKGSVEGFQGKQIYKLMDWQDKVCLKILDVLMSRLNENRIYNFVAQKVFNIWWKRAMKRHGITPSPPYVKCSFVFCLVSLLTYTSD